ncbi:sigma-54-dependent Fis family transcriptional regulator [Carboxydocella sp. ULO1]|uniref:sigma-54 interaction domain-containing protein n=1 Tax=Carboxydocella sp. ULO1 TaxID=1926599 RepID=UPI0009ADA663|nr:sigma-54-dependent Fis family transcriptional regulator [Carboxydocella sp. ULO1]GAW27864.1 AAA family ATPase [Carboxydocella sp. ULO1]
MEISSRELAVILDSTHDGMIAVNREGAVTLFNAAAERLTGLKREEVIGRKAQEAIPNTRLHIVLETGVPELNQQQHLGKTTIITNRVPVKDEEGRVVGAVAVFRDVGDFEALAEELTNVRQIKTMLEAIINATNDAISVVDENGMQILINPAYTRLTGLTEADVLYKPATVDIVEGESMHYKVLRTRQPVRGVRMKIGPNKKEVMVNVAPIIVNNELKGSVGVIHDLSEIKKLTEELEHARRLIRHLEAKYTFDDIIGQSEELKLAVEQAERAAATPATVLLRGESGTGKELFAHAIHNASTRSSQKFIRVNCASLTDTLLESELFGYEEGAFTGAVKGGKRGLFEEANGGTIFLDEIGEISLTLQAKLLRVLQEKEVRRVGGTKAVPVDVRVIAATNANLEEKIREGSFREDLYYRLNVFPIFIPPLRRRKQDLPLLVRFLIGKFNREFGRQVERIEPEALKVLENYDWPGNVRELENVIGRAIINMRPGDTVIAVRHLPPLGLVRPQVEGEHRLPDSGWQGETLNEILARVERQVICDVLAQCGGNKTLAARKLNIAVRSLYYKMDRYGLR